MILVSAAATATGVGAEIALDKDGLRKAAVAALRTSFSEELISLETLDDARTAEAVLAAIGDRRVSEWMRFQAAAAIAKWPAASAGRTALVRFLEQNPQLDDARLRFYSYLGLPESERFFKTLIVQNTGKNMADIKEPVRCALAIRALARLPNQNDQAVMKIASFLDRSAPHMVRCSAAHALAAWPSRAALPPLISMVRDYAIGDVAIRSLFRLTGEDFGEHEAQWNEWLKSDGATVPLKMLSRDEVSRHFAAVTAANGAADPSRVTFYGFPLKTRNCVFVLDRSSSMRGARIEMLKTQMANLLASMKSQPSERRFGIVIFGSRVDSCAPGAGLITNDEAGFRKASRFMDELEAEGQTHMAEALEHVRERILPSGNVDTIVLLSDGIPSDATSAEVLALAYRLYSDYRVRFHTFDLGASTGPAAPSPDRKPRMLEVIATQSGGSCIVPQR